MISCAFWPSGSATGTTVEGIMTPSAVRIFSVVAPLTPYLSSMALASKLVLEQAEVIITPARARAATRKVPAKRLHFIVLFPWFILARLLLPAAVQIEPGVLDGCVSFRALY